MNDSFIIIPCGQAKRPTRSRARYLYTGSLFRANLAWALSVAPEQRIFVLSAKHGFLKLDDWVDPYDLKMGDDGCIHPSEIKAQADKLGIAGKRLYALGGALYLDALTAAGLTFTAPVRGLRMGMAMQALKRNRGVLPR